MLTTGRDGWLNLWNLYCACNTWGAKWPGRGDFGSDPSVPRTANQHQEFKSSATILLLTPQVNRIMCKSGVKGKMRVKKPQEAANRDTDASTRGIPVLPPTRCFYAFPRHQDVHWSASMYVFGPPTFIWSQLILLRLWRQCLLWLRAWHLQHGEYVDELKPHQTVGLAQGALNQY